MSQPDKTYLLSLVVPCYNEMHTLPLFVQETLKVTSTFEDVATEIILVDDGSKDETLKTMRQLKKEYSCIRYLSFSRNFGKEGAIIAGLAASKGDWVAVMDADLQDPPALLPAMLQGIREEGYDCVGTRRQNRKGEVGS